MNVDVLPDVPAFAEAAARFFVERAREAIDERGRFVVALAGGSTPAPLHRALDASALDWSKVVVLFGDERAVGPADERSNHRSAHETLLSRVPAVVHRIEGERADLHAVAREYERVMLDTCGGALDLLIVGLGQDAHILSLWPGCPAIEERTALVVATLDPPMNPAVSRVTMTPVAIERARHVLAIATGAGKQVALDRALHAPDDPLHCPAHLLRRAADLRWIVDRPAVRQ